MSGFDSNPFADPENASPFEASGTQPAPAASTLDDYNPFADKSAGASVAPPKAARTPAAEITPTPVVVQPSSDPPPAYTHTGEQRLDTSELQKRQEELEQKAAELREREERLKQAGTAVGARIDNWPPLPACCGVKPCFYQDFSVDIAVEFRHTVRFMYFMWIAYAVTNLLNVLLAIAYLCVNGTSGGAQVGLAFLWLLLWTPLAFLCWYRPVYKAFRSDSSINFFCFFFCFFIHIIVLVVSAIGIPGSGYTGFISASELVGGDAAQKGVGSICFLTAGLYAVMCGASVVMLIKIHRMYRYNTTASFSKAQAEFGTAVLKNEAVQQAGAQAVSSAATGAMQGAASSAQQSANRY